MCFNERLAFEPERQNKYTNLSYQLQTSHKTYESSTTNNPSNIIATMLI